MSKSTETIFLPKEDKLTITADAFASGLIFSCDSSGQNSSYESAITASSVTVLGPNNTNKYYKIDLDKGTVSTAKEFAGSPEEAEPVVETGWVHLQTLEADASETLDFEGLISSDHDNYMLVFTGLLGNGSVNAGLQVQYSADNGSTYLASFYRYSSKRNTYFASSGDDVVWTTSSNDTSIDLIAGQTYGAVAMYGILYLLNPLADQTTFCNWELMGGTGGQRFKGHGFRNNAEMVNAIRVLADTGSFTGGKVSLYGLAKPA